MLQARRAASDGRHSLEKGCRWQVVTGDQDSEHYETFSLGNFANTGFIALFSGRFSRGGNILGARALQDLLGFLRPLRIVRMNGQKNPAIFDAAFVSLGFVLRDSHADQSARKPTDRSADSRSSKSRHNRSSGYERPQSRNREGADTE